MAKRLLPLVLVCIWPTALQAAPLQLFGDVDLSMGELAVPTPSPGFYDLDAFTGASSASNAYQIGTANRGNIRLIGGGGQNVILTTAVDPMTCDTTYLPACVGTPTLTIDHTFDGQISSTYCPQPPRCQETVYVGGRFSFTGTEEGRWTTVINITANYQ